MKTPLLLFLCLLCGLTACMNSSRGFDSFGSNEVAYKYMQEMPVGVNYTELTSYLDQNHIPYTVTPSQSLIGTIPKVKSYTGGKSSMQFIFALDANGNVVSKQFKEIPESN